MPASYLGDGEMSAWQKTRRDKSIFMKLFIPLLGVLLFQVVATVILVICLNAENQNSLKKFLIISVLISGLLLLLAGYALSRHLSSIMKRVLTDLKSSGSRTSIKLDRVKIREVDSLIEAIENNSEALFTQARRVSRIVTYANPHLGVFEDDEKLPQVYCSANFFKIFGIKKYEGDVFVSREEFNSFFVPFKDKT